MYGHLAVILRQNKFYCSNWNGYCAKKNPNFIEIVDFDLAQLTQRLLLAQDDPGSSLIDTVHMHSGVCQKWKSYTIEIFLTFYCSNKTL